MLHLCLVLKVILIHFVGCELSSDDPLKDSLTYYETLNYPRSQVAESHARVKRSFDPDEKFYLSFEAHKRLFNLELKRDRNLFADGLEISDSSDFQPNSFYEGFIRGVKDSHVHGFVYDDAFEERIYIGDGTEFHIESSRKYKELKNCHSIIYDAKDVIHPNREFCKVKVANPKFTNNSIFGGELDYKVPENDAVPKVIYRERRASAFDSTRKECQIYMRADHKYSEWVGGDARALLKLASHVKAVNHIFQNVDFNEDQEKDGISIRIKRLQIIPRCFNGTEQQNTTECQFSKAIYSANTFLDLASRGNLSSYCLSYVLTHRNFGSTVGLAYIGSDIYDNGICDTAQIESNGYLETRNTGIVTTLSGTTEYVGKVVDTVLAHEIGHNFGAQHDPTSQSSCSPGGEGGNYLMYPTVQSGNYPNNFLFSTCSRDDMTPIIRSRGGCFSVSGYPICGNRIVESSEQCDCGYAGEVSCITDNCCNGFSNFGSGCSYSAKALNVTDSLRCSPSNGLCCDAATCSPYTTPGIVCSQKSDCASESKCVALQKECPVANMAADLTLCDFATYVCLNGSCSGSVCLRLGLEQCPCSSTFDSDSICCRNSNGTCSIIKSSEYMPKTSCGGTFTEESGNITSPNYPSNYSNQQICKYEIRVPTGKIIQFKLSEAELEDPSCRYDHLLFYENGMSIARYCKSGSTIYTNGNHLEIYFTSDMSVTAKGFVGTWISCDPSNKTSSDSCLKSNTFTSENGTLASPNYPSYFQKYLHVNYTISVPANRRIFFQIVDFDLGKSGCNNGYLTLTDNVTMFGRMFCYNASGILTAKNELEISFVTKQSSLGRGFKAIWTSFETVLCDQTFYTDNGTIKSPNYPSNYSNFLNCRYIINVSTGKRIRLELTDASLYNPPGFGCIQDYLDFKINSGNSSFFLGRYCKTGNVIYTNQNYLEINLLTSEAQTSRGILARWISCDRSGNSYQDPCFQLHSFNTDNGTLSSPNYPLSSQRNLNITYYITVSTGKRIEFTVFHYGSYYDCSFGYMIFTENKRFLRKLCYSQSDIISTAGNTLQINFVTSTSYYTRYFYGNWKTYEIVNCGSVHNSTNGTITSPNYPFYYSNYLECKYEINVAPGKRIRFEIEDARLENNLCTNDYLSFQENETFLGDYCRTGNVIYTKNNHLEVFFRTNGRWTRNGFRGSWTTCSNTDDPCVHFISIVSESGTITSPNYPQIYQNNLNIIYRIAVPSGKRIRFTFSSLALQHSVNCTNDYLIFKENSTVLGRYCTSIIGDIITTGNILEIIFVTDKVVRTAGFSALWYAFHGGFVGTCGGVFNQDTGDIASPNYPLNYENNLTCQYVIQASIGKRITFQLLDANFDNANCYYDTLLFYEDQTFLGSYCRTGNVVYANGNELLLNLTTNHNKAKHSFHGRWFSCDSNEIFYNGSCVQSISYNEDMNNSSSNSRGIVTSPNYPLHYQNNINITYRITVLSTKKILFQFTNAYFANLNCYYDYLLFKEKSTILGKYCQSGVVVKTSGNELFINFVTDAYGSSRGFQGTWISSNVHGTCGGNFQGESGEFVSPNYPFNYDNQLQCGYYIRVPNGKRLTLELIDAEFESFTCRYDYLTFREGQTVLGTYCRTGNVVYSSGNELIVNLTTDVSVTKRGFHAKWYSCNSNKIYYNGSCVSSISYTNKTGALASPNYPSNSQRSLNITYRITVTDTKKILFQITSASFSGINCNNYYLLFRENTTVLGKYCQTGTIYSTGNELLIDFVTSSYASSSTFKGQWVSVNSGFTTPMPTTPPYATCGGNFYQDIGNIASPNYPSNYNNSLNCRYLIRVSSGRRITFQLLDAKFEQTDCRYDYLKFTESGYSLGRYCLTGNVIYTNRNELLVTLTTDNSVVNRGFFGRWYSCDSNKIFYNGSCVSSISYNNNSGIITSPNYPTNYQNKLNITYLITVAREKKIHFEILNASFSSFNCSNDYLQFNENSEAQTKICESGYWFNTTRNELEVHFITSNSGSSQGFVGRWISSDRDFPTTTISPTTTKKTPGTITSTNTTTISTKTSTSTTLTATSIDSTTAPTATLTPTTTNAAKDCGGTFKADSGTLTSPNYPSNYDNNMNCTFIINVQNGKTIKFEILNAKFENPSCLQDYLWFKENDKNLGKYCKIGDVISTKGNQLIINFITDQSVTGKGFYGKWTSSSSSSSASSSDDSNVVPIATGISIPIILILIIIVLYVIYRWKKKHEVNNQTKTDKDQNNSEPCKDIGTANQAGEPNIYQSIHPYLESQYMGGVTPSAPIATLDRPNMTERSLNPTSNPSNTFMNPASNPSNAFMNPAYEGDAKNNQTINDTNMSIQRVDGNMYLLPQDLHAYENA